MSTKKGSHDNITTKETSTVTPVSSTKSFLEEQHRSVNETLDETKYNITRAIEGIGRNVPRNTKLYSNLSTGGTLLTEKLTNELRAAGLDNLQVSFQDADSHNSNYISTGFASFEKKKKAALLAKNSGFPLTINAVLHKQNLDNIDGIIRLAEDLGAERLELANTQFNGWALKNRILLLPDVHPD